MLPFQAITCDLENDSGTYLIRVEGLIKFQVREHYCTRPSCNCQEVLLEFWSEDDFHADKPFAVIPLSLESWQWQMDEKYRVKKNSPAEKLLRQFLEELPEETKSSFLRHYRQAKEYGLKHPGSFLDPQVLEAGQNILFAEVFGEEDAELFRLNIFGKDYIFDDQYCINPHCDCREAVITVIRLDGRRGHECGAVTVSFSGKCQEITGSGGLPPVQEWLKEQGRLALLKERYKKMKEIGRNLNREKAEQKRRRDENLVGRNDPCPCGSGKKHKKCCGRA